MAAKSFAAPSSKDREWLGLLAWYVIAGALHEAAHTLSAFILVGGHRHHHRDFFAADNNWKTVLFQTLFLRQTVLSEHIVLSEDQINVCRHVGWIFSLLLAIACCRWFQTKPTTRIAVTLTALEALSTDLFGMYYYGKSSSSGNNSTVLFCGNFGVLLLHEAWSKADNGKTALDILETMISITMVRGAQSGGVLSFDGKSGRAKRTRVVNRKRTDLSQLLRQKMAWEISFRSSPVPFLMGHTRFATSSKATLDGTHPHRWTPASWRRVYDFNKVAAAAAAGSFLDIKANRVRVENFVTHNGDFDFYSLNGVVYDLERIQEFLSFVLGPMPTSVDSCAIAGMLDLLRTQGSFDLSARYVICLGFPTSRLKLSEEHRKQYPAYSHLEAIGKIFEAEFEEMTQTHGLEALRTSSKVRKAMAERVENNLRDQLYTLIKPLDAWIRNDPEGGSTVFHFCVGTIDAFFDQDLFRATQIFLKSARGSFGVCMASSLDASRQICMAARGQPMSVAFYPSKGLVCYGSEQAAVKGGLIHHFPGPDVEFLGRSRGELDDDVLRLDLDDLSGEICLLDWGGLNEKFTMPPVSEPNKDLRTYSLMNGGIDVILCQENKATAIQDPLLYHRMTRMTRNRFVKPLLPMTKDPVLTDITDIPKICSNIQDEWKADKASSSLNRLTAYNLSRCLRTRMDKIIRGDTFPGAIDLLLTGCEVSLWLAEQFASDLQKAFPRLRIKATSSNKILGIYGQGIAIPALGFKDSPQTHHLSDTTVIIVSHSGGTFAPLACSSLLQSTTQNIFVVTSEWDTQIGKQLRKMDEQNETDSIFTSRIFSTEVGMRPAEPCSLSVVATQQLLTNLFIYLSAVLLSDERFRRMTAATITDQDLCMLETCNMTCVEALSEITNSDLLGNRYDQQPTKTEKELRDAGDLWAEHVLECAKAYMMTACYIFGTVVSGYPLCFAIAVAARLGSDSRWMFLVRLVDAAIYFWMPQINITILRIIQGRNLRHRMVCRTVVIGDIPWVAQAADAFLSKLFACSYSIAGLNVLSANPSDHLVHRFTHRVVRGTLFVCGRPDGRLSALSTTEASVCLSVNQASSIQSLGGTCESITIGHNPFKLPLTHYSIFLKRKRPYFLCERLLTEIDANEESKVKDSQNLLHLDPHDSTSSFYVKPGGYSSSHAKEWARSNHLIEEATGRSSSDSAFRQSSFGGRAKRTGFLPWLFRRSREAGPAVPEDSMFGCSIRPRVQSLRSATALIGAYQNVEDKTSSGEEFAEEKEYTIEEVVSEHVKKEKWAGQAQKLFHALDADQDGLLNENEFLRGAYRLQSLLSDAQLIELFREVDSDHSGSLDYDQFFSLLQFSEVQNGFKLPQSNRDSRGNITIEPSKEKYFGENLRRMAAGKSKKDTDFMLARSQNFCQELYETRIASLQRFVATTVMFHQLGKRVQDFFVRVSFGWLGYRMDRTQSILRIATTASPVSGADVRQRMHQMRLLRKAQHAVHVIATAFLRYKERRTNVQWGGRNGLRQSKRIEI